MALPDPWQARLNLPVISAPMFLVSGPQLVIEACKAGVVGTFPALNQRTSEGFEQWLIEIKTALKQFEEETGRTPAPFGVNLIVHDSNPRLQADLEICKRHEVELIITSLGAATDVVQQVQGYGGRVFHDVANLRHAQKAAAAGVDGLIAVCAGAGGHAGILNPLAFVGEVRQFFHGTLVLAGCISKGQDIAAAQVLGADMAYVGTRFINTQESQALADYKQMICDTHAADITYTDAISGIPANFLKPSLVAAGLDPQTGLAPEASNAKTQIDLGSELTATDEGAKAWKTIWSAGQGVGNIDNVPSVAALVKQLHDEYVDATVNFGQLSRTYMFKPVG